MAANSTCGYKREENPKPILPKCHHNIKCVFFNPEHRFKFYHDTFDLNLSERLSFLLGASRYKLDKKDIDYLKETERPFSKRYLWEQFSCDLKSNGEVYHKFLIYVYKYVIDNTENDDLMAISQGFMTLEENNVSGIYYLNRAFMLWCFKFLSLKDLYIHLDKQIRDGVIFSYFDIHFTNLLKIIKNSKELLNEFVLRELEKGTLDETSLKVMYSEFMLSSKYRKFGIQKAIFSEELTLIQFQQQIDSTSDSYTISNSGLLYIIKKLLESNGYTGDLITGHLF